VGRKKSRSEETPLRASAEETENGTPLIGKRGDKTEAVKRALAAGIEQPQAIVDHVKTTYGIDISLGYASGIKSNLKRARGKKRRGRKPTAITEGAETRSQKKDGLAGEHLIALNALAEKAGGVDRLQEYLDVLKKLH
jgi:hypothetical protein